MSVINKVLRDLDQRQMGRRAGGVAQGAVVVGQGAAQTTANTVVRWAMLGLLLLAALALGAYLAWRVVPPTATVLPAAAPQPQPDATPAAYMAATVVPPPPQAPASEPVAMVQAAPPTKVSASAVPAAAPSTPKLTPKLVAKLELPARKVEPPSAAQLLPTTVAAHTVAVVAPAAPVATKASAAPLLSAATLAQPAPDSLTAAHAALAQAQVLWQQGNQAGALALVRSVVAQLQRSTDAPADVLAGAAREYVRMALAVQRAPDALSMLVQLETPLAKVADIWALRGSLAQRLGLHAQAVHAYLNALELSPGQARWMLAAAVSLAAQGQKAPAAELAEKARRAGFLPPDVANYLHQLGVELRAP